jgi:hypothetical protein
LENLPNPVIRANYIFVEAAKRGHVLDCEENQIECSEEWLDELRKGFPEKPIVLLKWEELWIENHVRKEYIVTAVATTYSTQLPKEDWEFHYFLTVLSRLRYLCKSAGACFYDNSPFLHVEKGVVEKGNPNPLISSWYTKYREYISIVQYQFRVWSNFSTFLFDRLPSWTLVEDHRLDPLLMRPEYYQLRESTLGGDTLERLTWEEVAQQTGFKHVIQGP